MRKLHFTITRGTHGHIADAAYVSDDEDDTETLRAAVVSAIDLDVHVTIAGVTMPLAMWSDPEHWATDWAKTLNVELDDAPEAVAGLLAAALEE